MLTGCGWAGHTILGALPPKIAIETAPLTSLVRGIVAHNAAYLSSTPLVGFPALAAPPGTKSLGPAAHDGATTLGPAAHDGATTLGPAAHDGTDSLGSAAAVSEGSENSTGAGGATRGDEIGPVLPSLPSGTAIWQDPCQDAWRSMNLSMQNGVHAIVMAAATSAIASV